MGKEVLLEEEDQMIWGIEEELNELPKVFYENTSKIISPVAGC